MHVTSALPERPGTGRRLPVQPRFMAAPAVIDSVRTRPLRKIDGNPHGAVCDGVTREHPAATLPVLTSGETIRLGGKTIIALDQIEIE